MHGYVENFFLQCADQKPFKTLLRDFLIQLKQFSSEDSAELYLEEKELAAKAAAAEEMQRKRAIPGMLNPHEANADMDDDL